MPAPDEPVIAMTGCLADSSLDALIANSAQSSGMRRRSGTSPWWIQLVTAQALMAARFAHARVLD